MFLGMSMLLSRMSCACRCPTLLGDFGGYMLVSMCIHAYLCLLGCARIFHEGGHVFVNIYIYISAQVCPEL